MEASIICSDCHQKIDDGEYVNLDPKFFHVDHFTCKACKEKLGGKNYFEKDQEFYCEEDFQKLFGVKCQTCNIVIKEQYVSILGKNYHSTCFLCFSCKKPFKDDQYFNFEGNPFCAECSQQKARACEGCGKPILDKLYSALDKYWHLDCFKCVECGNTFQNEGFLTVNGKNYHQKCFKLACVICGKNCTEEYYQVENNQACHSECIAKYKENRKKVGEAIEKAEKKLEDLNISPSKPVKKDEPTQEPTQKPTQEPTQKPTQEPTVNVNVEVKKTIEPKEEHKESEPVLMKPNVENQIQAGVVGKSVSENKPVFPYEQLIKAPFPNGVDINKREEYLSDVEFQKTFKMSKDAFKLLPKWKQNENKKKLKLF